MSDLFSVHRLARFVWTEKRYLWLLPLAMLFGTLFHEAAHALTAITQGAQITELSITPGWSPEGYFRFGYVSHTRPRGLYSESVILLAPILAWTLLAASTALWVSKITPGWRVKTSLIFLYFLPLADVSMQLRGLFYGAVESDLHRALHGVEINTALVACFYFGGFGGLGYRLFRGAYGAALHRAEFALGYAFILGASWLLRP